MIRPSASLLRASLCGLLLASVSAPALASAATDEQQPVDAAAAVDDAGLGTIVVTATKRETNLQETPISMAVMSTEALKDRHVSSLYDLADGAVPSLRIATFEARQSALTIGIRGIVPLDANQPAREQGVGIYVDGVYMGRQHGLNAALFDVERVEVLKGPQGTLFGRNTEGGALSIVSKAPTGEFGGRVEAGTGNYGGRTADAHIDLPKIAGFSVKLDGVIQHQDATTRNPMAGQAGWNYYNRKGLRAAVRWQPTSTITNDFSYDVAKDENTPFYSQLLNYNPNGCQGTTATSASTLQSAVPACYLPGTNYTDLTGTVKPRLPGLVTNGDTRMGVADIGVPQQVSVDKTHGFTNLLKWEVSPEIELRSITAWRGVDATQWDNSGGGHRPPVVANQAACTLAQPCAFSRYSLADLRQRQFSQELQAVGTVGSIDYVAGLFYFNEHVSDDAATPSSMGLALVGGTPTYVRIPFCTTSTPAFVGSAVNGCSIDRASEVWSKSYAAYGQLTWNATDALHITVGGRYTRDEKKGVLHYSRNVNYDLTPPAASVGYKPLDATWNRFNPMATVAYDFNKDLHVYAKYATGYRAGGASSRTSNYQAFNPEDVKSYEVGLKSDFWNNRARFNLAGYIMDRKNSQVDISSIQFVGTSSFNNLVTINAPGITKIRGIEADLTVEPIDGLTLNASYAYTYTKIPPVLITATDSANRSTSVYQNFYIVFTPRNAASGSIDYALPIGGGDTKLKFHFDGNYSQATQAFDQFATKNDSSLIFNGRISLADIGTGNGRNLTLSIWGRNLFNEQYVFRRDPSNSLPGAPTGNVTQGSVNNVLGDYGNFNAPRTYGVEASVKF
ncbi:MULTISPECIES: TonB-dependent receptor [unclassified Sphingobium]|uniref:TonB-dependent receptor n=1 Tax=unclassified Sphingobium TaxID=2611147 RepID=UPI0007704DE1|nr:MULTISPECIES: TonB-dependent receptor [Sphingomonadaceae]AMK23954.1 TonB-dependent receptor [Sphingobium sp. TKS]NML89272.1 TonB-dependent receptor [Sphingobium sp. TB-6]